MGLDSSRMWGCQEIIKSYLVLWEPARRLRAQESTYNSIFYVVLFLHKEFCLYYCVLFLNTIASYRTLVFGVFLASGAFTYSQLSFLIFLYFYVFYTYSTSNILLGNMLGVIKKMIIINWKLCTFNQLLTLNYWLLLIKFCKNLLSKGKK